MAGFLAKNNWVQDDAGNWWYHSPNGRRKRERGRIRTCETCGIGFPSLIGSGPGRFCSGSCDRGTRTRRGLRGRAITRPDLFHHWTAAECWLAGLIWADGCLVKGVDGRLGVTVTSVDEDVIAQGAAVAGANYYSFPIKHRTKLRHQIHIGANDPVERLQAIGLRQRKSGSALWPDPDVPHPLAFLRGAFDGDGYVMVVRSRDHLKSSLCGSLEFLQATNRLLASHGITEKKIRLNGRSTTNWQMEWQHADSLRLASLMYADGGPRMARKHAIFAAYMGGSGELASSLP